jgi:hypothetical protein
MNAACHDEVKRRRDEDGLNPTRLAPQPQILDCGGKRSATPLWDATGRTESGVAAALCHRSPNLCRSCAKLQDLTTDDRAGNPGRAYCEEAGITMNHELFNLDRAESCF